MVELVKYPSNKPRDKCRGQSEKCFISNWRSKPILSSTLERSIFQNEKWRFVADKSLKREEMKMLKINSSMDTIKSIDRGVSEYWGDVLRYHWPIAIQSFFLVIIILIFGPWIGLRCNDDVAIDDNINDNSHSSLWWWPLMGLTETSKSPATITRESCTYGYFCSTKKTQGDESIRRKTSFLKRKRSLKDLID